MRKIEVTFPAGNRDEVEEVLESYEADPVFLQAEREGEDCLRCEIVQDSEIVDSLIKDIKGITEIESGDLVIEVLEQTTRVEKGEKQEGGGSELSHYEMYTRAFDFADFEESAWGLIALSSVIAVIGLAIQNVIVVIGSMVIAPMLGPFIASSFGIVVGDREIIGKSSMHGAGSVLLSVLTAFLLGMMFDLGVNPLIRLVSEPGFGTVPLSLSVGAASALAFSSEARETLAGVAVAIALVPPSAAAGLMLANFDLASFFDVSLILVSNTMSIVLAGSLTFKLLGVKADTSYRRNVSKQKLRKTLAVTAGSLILISAIVGYTSYKELNASNAKSEVEKVIVQELGEKVIRKNVDVADNGIEARVTAIESNITASDLKEEITEATGREVKIQLTELKVSKEN